jgi:hypothetical protein
MHDKQAFGISLSLISGTGMTWHARNCSCIFAILDHLSDLILFFCFLSSLFAFSSFGFVFSVSQTLSSRSEIGNFFSSFVLPRPCSLVSTSVFLQKDLLCFHLLLHLQSFGLSVGFDSVLLLCFSFVSRVIHAFLSLRSLNWHFALDYIHISNSESESNVSLPSSSIHSGLLVAQRR